MTHPTMHLTKSSQNINYFIPDYKSITYDFCEESLGDRFHCSSNLYTDSVARSVFSEPVTALVLTIEPLQSWPSVDAGRKKCFTIKKYNNMLTYTALINELST